MFNKIDPKNTKKMFALMYPDGTYWCGRKWLYHSEGALKSAIKTAYQWNEFNPEDMTLVEFELVKKQSFPFKRI